MARVVITIYVGTSMYVHNRVGTIMYMGTSMYGNSRVYEPFFQ